MPRYYCTYFDRNYLARALALLESLRAHETGDFRVFAVCLDELSRVVLEHLHLPHVTAVPLHEIERGDSDLRQARSNRSLVEYYWTLTPTIVLWLLERHPEMDVLTYLDADLFFFSSPDPIFEELGQSSVLIHEHRFAPRWARLEPENGKYNVGLLCFRNDPHGLEALRWWRERCLEWCYHRTENGKMGDQMYLNDWPSRFARVVVLQHVGAGLAPWNYEQYTLGADDAAGPTVGRLPVVFFHFQSLALLTSGIVIPAVNPYPLTREILSLCYLPYVEALTRGLKSARGVLPDFSFGFESPGKLKTARTCLARRELRNEFLQLGLHKTLVQLSERWDCHCSPELGDSAPTSEPSAASEDDILVQLAGQPVAREIRVIYVVGAHKFQEQALLRRIFPNLQQTILFEPHPALFADLERRTARSPDVRVFPFAIAESNGTAPFHITDNEGASSSLLPMGKHRQLFPHVRVVETIEVECRRLEDLIDELKLPRPDMLFLDTQGAEHLILGSLSPSFRRQVRLIYTEASLEEVYQGSKTLDDLERLLGADFSLVGYKPLTAAVPTHGNAAFLRRAQAQPSATSIPPSHAVVEEQLPFMDRVEILAILSGLQLFRAPIRALEWGSGGSTLYFSSFLPPGSRWDSIEHDLAWFTRTSDQLEAAARPDVRVHHVPPNAFFREGIDDGDAISFRDYVRFPQGLAPSFELIIVDGRARVDCMRSGWPLLTDDGLMILHDAQRADYARGVPFDCCSLRVINPLLESEGPIAVLFMSRSASVIKDLSTLLSEKLPATARLEVSTAASGVEAEQERCQLAVANRAPAQWRAQ